MASGERPSGRRRGCSLLGTGRHRRAPRPAGASPARDRRTGTERELPRRLKVRPRRVFLGPARVRQCASAASLRSAVSSLRGSSSRIVTMARRGPGRRTSSSKRTFPLGSTTASTVRIIIVLQTRMIPQSVPVLGAANATLSGRSEQREPRPAEAPCSATFDPLAPSLAAAVGTASRARCPRHSATQRFRRLDRAVPERRRSGLGGARRWVPPATEGARPVSAYRP
jgi:hypothetical protein